MSPRNQTEVNVDLLEKRSGGLESGDQSVPKRARFDNEPNLVSPEQGGSSLRHVQADFSHFDGNNESVPEASEGELPRKATRRPHEPTAQEKLDHDELHEPYRAWCPVCVAGRGRAEYSHKADRSEDAIPVFAWDYGYMKKTDSSFEPDFEDADSPDQTGGRPNCDVSGKGPLSPNWQDSRQYGPLFTGSLFGAPRGQLDLLCRHAWKGSAGSSFQV